MNRENIFKFPRTKHLLDASPGKSNISRDDLIMDRNEMREFLQHTITVEEKVDGANLGISIDMSYCFQVQNRSHFITSKSHKQFSALDSWLASHSSDLLSLLMDKNFVLFGEWLAARHSIHYTKLSGYFLAFDIYDRETNAFLSRRRVEELLQSTSIPLVPVITEKRFTSTKEVIELLETKSLFYDGPVEGIYLRVNDDAQGVGLTSVTKGVLVKRAKIVRPDFLQQIEDQWTKSNYVKNIVSYYG